MVGRTARIALALCTAGAGGAAIAIAACGGTESAVGATDSGAADATGTPEAATDAGDGGIPDAGPTCAPPTDPTMSALCVRVAPEAIAFLADVNLDGKGLMVVDVHNTPNPDAPDGAPLPSLESVTLPGDAGADAGEIDLSAPVPEVRFDGLPPTMVFPRVVFVDVRGATKVGPGWWIGGYDLSNGVRPSPHLKPVTLTPGAGTTLTIDLIALRALVVDLSLGVQPVGNAMGPASFVVIPDEVPRAGAAVLGAGGRACANVSDGGTSPVTGFVIGAGANYVLAQVDDFGDAGLLGPGTLSSVSFVDGGVVNPPSTRLNYAADQYVIHHAVTLSLAIPKPDAGPDPVSCP